MPFRGHSITRLTIDGFCSVSYSSWWQAAANFFQSIVWSSWLSNRKFSMRRTSCQAPAILWCTVIHLRHFLLRKCTWPNPPHIFKKKKRWNGGILYPSSEKPLRLESKLVCVFFCLLVLETLNGFTSNWLSVLVFPNISAHCVKCIMHKTHQQFLVKLHAVVPECSHAPPPSRFFFLSTVVGTQFLGQICSFLTGTWYFFPWATKTATCGL